MIASWSKARLLEVVHPFLEKAVEAVNHPSAAVLLELIDRELAISAHRHPGTREAPPRKIANTLGRMPLAALVNLLCSKLTGHFPMLLKKVLTDLRREVGGEASESM